MLPFDVVIIQKHGYSSKHRESENKSYRLLILERRTMTPSKRCLLLVISFKNVIFTRNNTSLLPGYLQSEINVDPSRRRIAFYISDTAQMIRFTVCMIAKIMPKYIQGCKLCPISQHILFCSACMYKSAFGHDDCLAPSRRQATVVSNGDSFHWWTQVYGIYNYNWTHNIVNSRYLAVAFIGGHPIARPYGRDMGAPCEITACFAVVLHSISGYNPPRHIKSSSNTFSTLLSFYNLWSMPISKMVVTSQTILFRVYSERQNHEQTPNIFRSAFMRKTVFNCDNCWAPSRRQGTRKIAFMSQFEINADFSQERNLLRF